jgi:hypothetical protein
MPTLGALLDLERCPHCRIHRPNLGQRWVAQSANYKGVNANFWATYACASCGEVVLAKAGAQNSGVSAIYPSSDVDMSSSAIPSRAQAYLRQAADSLIAPSGSVVLSASAVDAMLKAKGYRDGSLYARIDKAAADHLITNDMAAWAHDVRLDANDERHADDSAPLPEMADAQRCLDFAVALATFLFVLPDRVQRGRQEAAQKS